MELDKKDKFAIWCLKRGNIGLFLLRVFIPDYTLGCMARLIKRHTYNKLEIYGINILSD